MLPIIELSGSYQAMGEQFGEQFRTEIKQFAQTRINRLISFVKKYGKVNVSEEEVLDIAETLLPVHQGYDSNIWQEFHGIATGANISLPWLLVANGYTDLRDYICKIKGFNDTEVRFEGCTAFLLDKTMSQDNKIVLAQTWDMSVEAMDYLVVVKKTPDNGPSMMYVTTMGAMALIGVNNNNIAVGTTNLMANDCQQGVNYLFTISKALAQDKYHSVINTITATKRLSGHSFLCAGTDQANLIESSATSYQNYKLDHYPLVITNNYSEAMRANEIFIPEQRRRNSMYRQSRAMAALTTKAKWSPDELWQVLADDYRNDSGAAICNEDYTGQYGEFATLCTILLIPQEKKLWVCRGGAANGKVQKVSL